MKQLKFAFLVFCFEETYLALITTFHLRPCRTIILLRSMQFLQFDMLWYHIDHCLVIAQNDNFLICKSAYPQDHSYSNYIQLQIFNAGFVFNHKLMFPMHKESRILADSPHPSSIFLAESV